MKGPFLIENSQDLDLAVTWANLTKHIETHGFDNTHTKKFGSAYTTYKKLAADSAIEVGRAYFGEETYVQLVLKYGEASWEEAARADWAAIREEEA